MFVILVVSPTENGLNSYRVSHCIAVVQRVPGLKMTQMRCTPFDLSLCLPCSSFWFHEKNNLLFPCPQDCLNPRHCEYKLLVSQTFHTDWSYFILSTMNPIRFLLFRNSPEAMLNCLLIRPLWHDHNCSVCTHTHAPTGAHIYMHAQHTNTHTLLSTLLICL